MTILGWILGVAGFWFICKLCYNRGFANGVIAAKLEDLHTVVQNKYPDVSQTQRVPLKVEIEPRGRRGPG